MLKQSAADCAAQQAVFSNEHQGAGLARRGTGGADDGYQHRGPAGLYFTQRGLQQSFDHAGYPPFSSQQQYMLRRDAERIRERGRLPVLGEAPPERRRACGLALVAEQQDPFKRLFQLVCP